LGTSLGHRSVWGCDFGSKGTGWLPIPFEDVERSPH
jgi:hypothetical protein